MAEYIEREKIIFSILGLTIVDPAVAAYADAVVHQVRSVQSADVTPVQHGQWNGEGDGYADGEIVLDVWYCSECDYCIDDGTDDPSMLPRYCPDCGAKMDGGVDK